MNAGELVADKGGFSFLSEQCGKIFDTSKRLPDFVFRRSFAKYFAIEYGHIYGKSFGSFFFRCRLYLTMNPLITWLSILILIATTRTPHILAQLLLGLVVWWKDMYLYCLGNGMFLNF